MVFFWVIPVSFAICATLFLGFFHLGGCTVEDSCSKVSLCHHFAAMCLGLWTHWMYLGSVGQDASFAPNTDFPLAIILQHFNIGYFLYDTVHVVVWDQRWLMHHIIALAGYSTSELGNVFALANAVNTWVTELGSLMYSAYLVARTEAAYKAFVGFYSLSRLYFVIWSWTVLTQVWDALQGRSRFSFAAWCPYCAATLQIMLLIVNLAFALTHIRKLLKRKKGRTPTQSAGAKRDN